MKVSEIKQKVAAKVAKGKAKVAKKCGTAKKGKAVAAVLVSCLTSLVLTGCQSPAQRAQTAEATQKFYIYEGATATFTFGSEFLSLAQSNETGGNDAGQVATQTTDTKPEIAVGVGGSSAGVGQSAGTTQSGKFAKIGAAVDAVTSLVAPGIGGDVSTDAENAGIEAKPAEAADAPDAPQAEDASSAAKPCADGNCADCADGSCSKCPGGACSE